MPRFYIHCTASFRANSTVDVNSSSVASRDAIASANNDRASLVHAVARCHEYRAPGSARARGPNYAATFMLRRFAACHRQQARVFETTASSN